MAQCFGYYTESDHCVLSQTYSLVELGKRLLEASKNGHTHTVVELVKAKAPFTTDWIGMSPLHFASMNGHIHTCETLIYAGCSIDAKTKVDRTSLHLASQEGHADIVELLLKNGADIEMKDMLQMTALHWAAERGHIHVIQVLLEFGANINIENKFKLTPIQVADFKNHIEARDFMCDSLRGNYSSKLCSFNLTVEEDLIPDEPPANEITLHNSSEEKEIESFNTVAVGEDLGMFTEVNEVKEEDLVSNRKMIQNIDEEGYSLAKIITCKDDLLEKLALFISEMNQTARIVLNEVGINSMNYLDHERIMNWFVHHQINVYGYDDNFTYDISFTYNELEFSLSAVYISEHDSIIFKHHLALPKKL